MNIHGGPHGQQGPAFNFKNQVYAARGWATLMVNYRGSTGYGQAFADAVFADQNGNEGQDVLYGVSAAMRRYPWIDRDRLGVEGTSYGGQLCDVADHADQHLQGGDSHRGDHQPDQLQLHDLLQPVRGRWSGASIPHQGNLMDTLLQRSAIRHVANAHTPTMLMHGENDNDVPIAEAEQFYIALQGRRHRSRDGALSARRTRHPRIEARRRQHRSEHPLVREALFAAQVLTAPAGAASVTHALVAAVPLAAPDQTGRAAG